MEALDQLDRETETPWMPAATLSRPTCDAEGWIGDASTPMARVADTARPSPGTAWPSSGTLCTAETMTAALVAPAGDPDEDDPTTERHCVGCYRGQRSGVCFWSKSVISWAVLDGRGHWCKDCHNLWRVLLRETTSLALLGPSLSHPANRSSWWLHLVAYISLRKEGSERITRPALLARVDAFYFYETKMCMPPLPVIVMPLQVYVRNMDTDEMLEKVNPSRLCTMFTGDDDQPCLGYFVDESVVKAHNSHVLQRPRSGSQASPGSCALRLWSNSPGDRDTIRAMACGNVAAAASSDWHGGEAEIGEVSSPLATPEHKLRAKVQQLHESMCKMLSDWFTSRQWEADIKESLFTPFSHKLSCARTEAAARSDEQTVRKVDEWLRGWQVGKTFARHFRDWCRRPKMQQDLGKLAGMADSLQKFCDFLSSIGIRRSQCRSLQLHLLYVSVVSDYFERNLSWPQSWNKFFHDKEDVATTFAGFTKDTETPSFEPWLRGLLFLVLAHKISTCPLDEVVALPEKLLLSIQETQKCIALFGDKHGCKQEALLHDLEMLTRLCEASTRVRGTHCRHCSRGASPHLHRESYGPHEDCVGQRCRQGAVARLGVRVGTLSTGHPRRPAHGPGASDLRGQDDAPREPHL